MPLVLFWRRFQPAFHKSKNRQFLAELNHRNRHLEAILPRRSSLERFRPRRLILPAGRPHFAATCSSANCLSGGSRRVDIVIVSDLIAPVATQIEPVEYVGAALIIGGLDILKRVRWFEGVNHFTFSSRLHGLGHKTGQF
jgi:hypothetical protein